jgi:Putative sterol carrier protein
MSLETVVQAIDAKRAEAAHLNAKILFDFGEDGAVFIDATQNPPEILQEKRDADVTLSCALETFESILNGTQDPNVAFMFGKLKIQGNMKLAMKLNAFLEE